MNPTNKGAVPASVARLATRVLLVLSALSAVVFVASLTSTRPPLLRALPLVLAVGFVAATRLRPSRRVSVALSAFLLSFGVVGVEALLNRKRKRPGSAALARGATYDSRNVWELVAEHRSKGATAYTSIHPRALLDHPFGGAERYGIEVGGKRMHPLGGIADTHIVYCQEGGTFVEYDSDEHGFNNPPGSWASMEVALLGDSFTHGACVEQSETFAGVLRARHPGIVSLGMGGNGPLTELGQVVELLTHSKPKTVVWLYYNNDLSDLGLEAQNPILIRYLEPGFSQGIWENQAAITESLKAFSDRVQKEAPSWPVSWDSAGLTRERAPLALEDILMGEAHSNLAAVLRLDRVNMSLGALLRVNEDYLDQKQDPELFQKVLARADEEVKAWGGRLYFAYLPDIFLRLSNMSGEHPDRAHVLEAAGAVGLPVLDLDEPLRDADFKALTYHFESHYNPAGYARVAETLEKALIKEGALRAP